jgi:hypothetical protein
MGRIPRDFQDIPGAASGNALKVLGKTGKAGKHKDPHKNKMPCILF